jgi:hypothetical protein
MGFLKKIVKSVKKVAKGDLLGAAGAVASGYLGSNAAKKAANTQADSANYAAQLQQQQFDKQLELQRSQFDRTAAINEQQFNKQLELNAPFREAGLSAQNRLMQLYGLGPNTLGADYGSAMRDFSAADFQVDPGYAFRQQQGEQGMERSAAARGGLLSGGAIKDAQRFNQGLASAEFGDAYNRFQTNRANRINPLQSLMGSGQSATGVLTNASQGYANNAANASQNYVAGANNASQNYANRSGELAMGAGNARASGYVGQANAIGNALGQGINNYQQNQLMKRMYPRNQGMQTFPTTTPPFNPSYGSFPSYDGSSVQG